MLQASRNWSKAAPVISNEVLASVKAGWENYAQMAFATADFGVVAVAMNNGGARIPEQLQAEFQEFTRTYQVGRVPYLLIYDFPKTRPMFHAYPPNHPGTSPKKFPFFPDHLGGGWYYLLQDSVSWAEIVSPYSDTFVEVTRKGNEWVVEIHLPIVNGELLKDTYYHAFMAGRNML